MFQKAFSSDERHRIFLTVAKHCKLQENATDADVEEMLKYEAPTTEEGSCLRACLFEMFGMVSSVGFNQSSIIIFDFAYFQLSNDTLVEEAINSLSAASIDDAGLAEASKNTTEECVSKVTGLKR